VTAAPRRTKCAEEDRHKAQRQAGTQVSLWLFGYAKAHGLSDLDMLGVLAEVTAVFLRYAARDDEERRTGYRHRLAGE
jgi:hypothetical protein